MDTYDVEHVLHHDGEVYEPGDEISLSDEEAENLLEKNPAPISEPSGPEAEELTEAERRIEDLEEALAEAREPHPLMPKTVPEVSHMADGIEDADRLREAIAAERDGPNRTSAISNLEDRIEELESVDENEEGEGDDGE